MRQQGRQLTKLWGDLRERAAEDPDGRSAAKLLTGVGMAGLGVLVGVGDAASLLLSLLVGAGLVSAGRYLEPAGSSGPLHVQRGEGLPGNLHLLAYAVAVAVVGYALVNLAISVALLVGGIFLLRSGWLDRGKRGTEGLLSDARRLLGGAESDIRRALAKR